jgi:hypothetical protein
MPLMNMCSDRFLKALDKNVDREVNVTTYDNI